MQQIANLLIFQSAQPRTLGESSKPIAADAIIASRSLIAISCQVGCSGKRERQLSPGISGIHPTTLPIPRTVFQACDDFIRFGGFKAYQAEPPAGLEIFE